MSSTTTGGVDLSGLNLRSGDYESLCFEGFVFPDHTNFDDTVFPDNMSFVGAEFGDQVSFKRATFGSHTRFDNCRFGRNASFQCAIFGNRADFRHTHCADGIDFSEATFGDLAIFLGIRFAGTAAFTQVHFGDRADFGHCQCEGKLLLTRAHFGNKADFSAARLKGRARFNSARFGDELIFDSVIFHAESSFESAVFSGSASFHQARFLEFSDFSSVEFSGQASFKYVLFRTPPSLRGITGVEYLDLHEIEVRLGTDQNSILCACFGEWNDDEKIIPRLRTLRGVAEITHFVDAERELFLAERQMELGCSWVIWRGALSRRIRLERQNISQLGLSMATLVVLQLASLIRLMGNTVVMLLYRWSSNCGRSALWPAFWLTMSTPVFHAIYRIQYASLKSISVSELDASTIKLLDDFALGSLVPLAATTRPSYYAAIEHLFGSDGYISVPVSFQNTSMVQGVLDLVLIFLIGVALRNHFLVR